MKWVCNLLYFQKVYMKNKVPQIFFTILKIFFSLYPFIQSSQYLISTAFFSFYTYPLLYCYHFNNNIFIIVSIIIATKVTLCRVRYNRYHTRYTPQFSPKLFSNAITETKTFELS